MTGPAAGWLPGDRLHLQHGPIDLVIEAFGPPDEVATAYRQAWVAFRPVLDDLVAVLPLLRAPVTELLAQTPASPRDRGDHAADCVIPAKAGISRHRQQDPRLRGDDAHRQIAPSSPAAAMIAAATRHAPAFVTPMAAVAGAVADHVLAAMTAGRRLDRAYVNNGGDAALWLTSGTEITAAGGPALADRIRVTAGSPVRGVATSGWRGRSHSLGIADAVTVLARTAAEADVAATLIANAIDLPGHPAVTRRPARDLAPDSDLGDRLVTVEVGPLSPEGIARALAVGRAAAEAMRRDALITAAALWLAGESVTVGDLPRAVGAIPARA